MKLKLFSILSLVSSLVTAQQLANMDFEDWSYDPLSRNYTILNGPWNGNNSCTPVYPGPTDTICNIFITRQTDSKSGKYSLKLQTPTDLPGGTGGFTSYDVGTLAEQVPFPYAPISFSGYYKFIKGQKDDEASISVDFFDSDLNTVKYGVKLFIEAKTWSKFTVDLFDIPPSSNIQYVQLTFYHATNQVATPSLSTYLMLDGLSFTYGTSAVYDEAIKNGFRFNDGFIDISQMHDVSHMYIYDLNGTLCGSFQDTFDTHLLKNGIYAVGYEENGTVKKFKLPVNN